MEAIEEEFAEFFKLLAKTYGMGDLQATVLSVLYLEPNEVAMEEIAKRTGYSLASISNTMKMLEGAGVVRRVKKPGTNKVFFYMEKDLIKLNLQKIKAAYESIINPGKEMLPKIIEKYGGKVGDRKSREKLRIIENYYHQMIQLDKLLRHMSKKLERMSAENRIFNKKIP
ncbi:MAG: hypothetical protein B6U72_03815 [Candidatus Altiarchaeales archaeon ex4484_2]|nr:MAG: hypothetical protein B6U72_03815 [Candidatus Altiarchaeales archaeon ex4484_2]